MKSEGSRSANLFSQVVCLVAFCNSASLAEIVCSVTQNYLNMLPKPYICWGLGVYFIEGGLFLASGFCELVSDDGLLLIGPDAVLPLPRPPSLL